MSSKNGYYSQEHGIIIRAANICILHSGRFCTTINQIYRITFNIIGTKFPQSGSFSNPFTRTWKDWFICWKLSADLGIAGSSVSGLPMPNLPNKYRFVKSF